MDEYLPSVSLASYTIRIHPRGSDEFEPLGFFGPSGLDMREVLGQYLKSLKQLHKDAEARSTLRIKQFNRDEGGSVISGVLKTGEYGLETDVIDIDTGVVAFTSKRKHASEYPFTFLFYLPPNEDIGFVILQRFKNMGVSELLLKGFQKYFKEQDLGSAMQIGTISPAEAFKQVFDAGNVKRVRFIKMAKARSIEKAAATGAPEEEEFSLEIQAYARRRKHIGKKDIQEYVNGKLSARGLIQSVVGNHNELAKFQPDFVKVEMATRRGKKRTLNVTNIANLRSYHDITYDVTFDNTGFPNPSSVEQEARELLGDLLEEHGRKK